MMQTIMQYFSGNNLPIAILALTNLLLHLLVNLTGGYGYFRDELYYIACSENLALGYVDHPPLSIFILWLNRMMFGDSIFSLRLLPAVSGAILIFLTASFVKEMGGNKQAQIIAALVIFVSPIFLAINDFFSMNTFEPLFWMAASLLLIRILKTRDTNLWIWFGIVTGLGLQNKYSMAFFVLALLIGSALSGYIKLLMNRQFLYGMIIAFLFFLPHIIWQMVYNFPTLEFIKNAQQYKNLVMAPADFISAVILIQHPFSFPLWFAGLFGLFVNKDLKSYKPFGITFLILLILFIVQNGKPYYLSPAFPVLIASGAIIFAKFAVHPKLKSISKTYITALVIFGLIFIPVSLPVLPVESYIRYSNALGISQPKMEKHSDTPLPQVLADRFGWEEMVKEVSNAFYSLSREEQNNTIIYAQNYGQAGAVDFFGKKLGLPRASSGHNNYWLWGPALTKPEAAIIIGGEEKDHLEVFESVEIFSVHINDYAMPYETNLPIFICRYPKTTLDKVWEKVKLFI